MKKLFFVKFWLVIFYSCTTPAKRNHFDLPASKNKDSLSIYYNNKGSEYYMMKGMPDSAIIFFDSAIFHDKTNIAPYNNKFQILIERKDYLGALKLMKTYEEVDREYYPILSHIGILSEKTNDKTIHAKEYYQRALHLIDKQIKTEEGDILSLYIGKANLLTLLNMKDSADNIYDRLLIEYPDFQEIILESKNSDRQDILNAY